MFVTSLYSTSPDAAHSAVAPAYRNGMAAFATDGTADALAWRRLR